MAVNGKALGLAVAGAISAWTGLTSPTGNPRDVLSKLLAGQQPALPGSQAPGSSGVATGPAGIAPGASASGTAIATDAASYVGHCYTFGGTPGPSGQGCWDCSSFVNWVLGHDFRLAIPGYPGGSYNGQSHGPSSFMYPVWGGVTHIPRQAVQPGDLCVWMNPIGHIGIAISNSSMVSALDPSQGTQETPIDGTASGVLVCLRLKASVSAGTTQGPGTHTAGGRG